jgi:hypothetical protein
MSSDQQPWISAASGRENQSVFENQLKLRGRANEASTVFAASAGESANRYRVPSTRL